MPHAQHEEQQMHDAHTHNHAFSKPDELAKKWNSPERDKWQHPEEIIAALALKQSETVVDVGAGTGYMVAHLSKAVGQDGSVVAIDTSTPMIDYLTKHRDEFGQRPP